MNDEQTSASVDETGVVPAPVEPERPTLDKIYVDHDVKIDDAAQKYRQDEFKPLAPVIREDGQEILSTLNAVTQEVNNLRQDRHMSALRSDIESAVATVEKETGLDPKLIEAYLDLQARDDPRFQKVWLERRSNPKVFNAALQAVSYEIADKFQARADPNLLANQRAMKTFASGSSTRQTSNEGGWDNLSPSEFNRRWSQMTNT